MPFCHTPHWTEFQECYQDKLTTAPEELALKPRASLAVPVNWRGIPRGSILQRALAKPIQEHD